MAHAISYCDIKGRQFVALLFTFAIAQIAFYYLSGAIINGQGPFTIAQPDALLYFQSARRIAEGHAFSFSAGTAASTGTTSVLYPFVLAFFYKFGFTGTKLFACGFVLNAFFYLVFLASWAAAFRKWLDERLAVFATILLVLFPQPAFCALAQSDTGMWMAVSGLIAYGLASNRTWLYAPLLVLSPWVRPEGGVLAIALGCVGLMRRNWRVVGIAVLTAISIVSLLLFNGWLTDSGLFSSVAGKGYFKNLPFDAAVIKTSRDLLEIFRDVILGISTAAPRIMYALPLLGAAVFFIGLCSRNWCFKTDWPLLALLLAGCGGLLIVAQSGWQGTNMDRYFAWLMPLVVFFHACGWYKLYVWASACSCRKLILATPMLFSLFANLYMICAFHMSSVEMERMVKFAQILDQSLFPSASVGTTSWCGLAYLFGNRRLAHLSGIYSPEFECRHTRGFYEILKNNPDTRFDYWLVSPSDTLPDDVVALLGPSEVVGPEGFEAKHMRWTAFDQAAKVPICDGKTLIDRLDVGYDSDERRSNYEIVLRYGMLPYEPILRVEGQSNTNKMIDVGRLVVGYDEMTVTNLLPGRDLDIVMRTVSDVEATQVEPLGGWIKTKNIFSSELDIHPTVDGKVVACCHAAVATNGFSDVVLRIPGKHITRTTHRIGLHGDHATFAYWFYQ